MIRVEPRAARGTVAKIATGAAIAAAALGIAGLALVAAAGFGGAGAADLRTVLAEMAARAAPLILTGLAASIAFRIRLYNLGGEGQFLAGAFAAFAVAAAPIPGWADFTLMLVAGMAAGALLMYVAAALKVHRGVDEAVVTLLINLIVLLAVQTALGGMEATWSAALPEAVPRAGAYAGVPVALVAAVGLALVMRTTVWGFQLRAVAGNPEAARFAGIPLGRTTLRVALMSGALAGLGGAAAVASGQTVTPESAYSGVGYAGIAVAVLAGRSIIAVVVAGIAAAGVLVAAAVLAGQSGIPASLADLFFALALTLALFGAWFAHYRLTFVRTETSAP